MILYKKNELKTQVKATEFFRESYLIINIFLAGVILLILAYSGIFSPVKNNYPVACIHEILTDQPCASCGLSHSLSLIIRGKPAEAAQWNIYGMRIFIFFVSQFILRIAFSFIYMNNPQIRRQLIIFDIAGSGIMFILAFMPFMRWIVMNAILVYSKSPSIS
jgi:hypothetical protein